MLISDLASPSSSSELRSERKAQVLGNPWVSVEILLERYAILGPSGGLLVLLVETEFPVIKDELSQKQEMVGTACDCRT